ncbi:hypothetical protein [Aquella oligotrophica]|uniref:Uncharacterized protein n=1 Tax=Aquella oligotrophica TaxID=2067065 RepID=A0A2I7N610_9NEIS|nr:hypothetical protein [Aquella oligotrophica]AUR51888.1 hypothetical protein CUN60_06115 [Aquella oligotrophica]
MNLKPGNNCDIMVGLSNSNTVGSGNSLLKLTYDNHNGSSATAGSNVNWVIGSATPSLIVAFYPNNNLSTMINGVATTTITLINNGGIALSDIRLPALPITLTYISGGAHPCSLFEQQLNAQNLATGQSCTLILQYSPTTATPQKLTSLGVFTANAGSYISDDYNINLTAISPRIISFDQAILKPSLNWTNSTSYSASVKVSNMSASVVTFEQAVSSDPYLSASGCSGSLASGDSCNLIISGNYPIKLANYEDSGSITVNYSDGINNHSTVLNVDATLAMQPVVTPGLLISGTLPSSLVPAIPTDIEITLTNETTATNGGDTTIKVNLDNLIGDGFNVSNGGGGTISGHLNINGLSNPCSASSGIITLASGASCNINMELTASGTTDNNTTYPQLTITPSFTYNVYSNSSTIPSISSTTNAISPLSGTIMVENPASALDFSTSVTTLSAEQNTTPDPTAVLTVTNVGDTALTSFSLPSINGILFNVPLSCNTLAAHASCDITISLSTTEVLSGNFADNTAYFTDNYHVTNQLVALPNFAYSVTAANIPNIQVTVNTSGCSSRTGGDGLLGTNCYLNPGNDTMMTGNAGALQLVITYTNTASAVAYNFLVAANPPANYTTLQNNCTNITLSKDDSCTLVYILANPSAYPSPSLNVNVATPLDNGYSYNYGIQSQFTGSGGASKPLSNDLQVISSKPSISFNLTYQTMLTNVAQTGSAAISNWFSAATPQVSINSSNSSVATASTPCVINFIGSGGNCNFMINSTATEGNSILNAAISAPDNTLINSSNRPLYTTKFYSYIFGNNSAGNKYLLMCNSSIANCNSANVSFNEPRHIVVNNGYLYVLNTMGNDITKCTINNISGDLTNCSSNNAGQFSNPLDLAFYNGYAYILSTANKVFRCNISSTTGDLTGCSQETNATGFSSANAISFNAIGGVTYAYIITSSDFGLVCQMNPANGSIASCNTSNVLGDGIAFQSGYAYIPSSGKLWVCSISTANGSLNNCVNNLIFNTVSYGIVYYDNYFRITSPNYTLYNVQYSGTTLIGGISSSVYWFGGYLSGIAVSFYPQ